MRAFEMFSGFRVGRALPLSDGYGTPQCVSVTSRRTGSTKVFVVLALLVAAGIGFKLLRDHPPEFMQRWNTYKIEEAWSASSLTILPRGVARFSGDADQAAVTLAGVTHRLVTVRKNPGGEYVMLTIGIAQRYLEEKDAVHLGGIELAPNFFHLAADAGHTIPYFLVQKSPSQSIVVDGHSGFERLPVGTPRSKQFAESALKKANEMLHTPRGTAADGTKKAPDLGEPFKCAELRFENEPLEWSGRNSAPSAQVRVSGFVEAYTTISPESDSPTATNLIADPWLQGKLTLVDENGMEVTLAYGSDLRVTSDPDTVAWKAISAVDQTYDPIAGTLVVVCLFPRPEGSEDLTLQILDGPKVPVQLSE